MTEPRVPVDAEVAAVSNVSGVEWVTVVLKVTMPTRVLVSWNPSRNAVAAAFTRLVLPALEMEPDSSRARTTSRPHDSARSGLSTGVEV